MKLKNKKHELFAQAVADGMTATLAYRTFISDVGPVSGIMSKASHLRNSPKVAARVQELEALANDITEHKLGRSKEHAMRILWEIIETPIGEMKKRHRLAERWSKTKHGERIGMPSKLDAMALLGEWAGWKKVQAQVHVNASVEDYSKGLLNSLPQEPGLPNHG